MKFVYRRRICFRRNGFPVEGILLDGITKPLEGVTMLITSSQTEIGGSRKIVSRKKANTVEEKKVAKSFKQLRSVTLGMNTDMKKQVGRRHRRICVLVYLCTYVPSSIPNVQFIPTFVYLCTYISTYICTYISTYICTYIRYLQTNKTKCTYYRT
jgi:hypothetical protein